MKRIILLIFLVMMATALLRRREDHRRFRDRLVRGDQLSTHEDRVFIPRSPYGQENRKRVELSHQHLRPVDPRSAPENESLEENEENLIEHSDRSRPADRPTLKVSSELMATEDRANADATRKLKSEITRWLEPEIPMGNGWKPSEEIVRSMIKGVTFTPVVKDYGTLYVAELTADTSVRRREKIIATYQHEMVQHRMLVLGGSLAFVLACLGIISAYIRTDEATRGYYTNRLRMLAAAGVGAAGVAIYRIL
jgi:hypothetical protein